MTNQNLRSLVLPIAFIGFVWTLAFSISSFQEINTDNSNQQKKLASLSVVLGLLYVGAAAIFLFGVFAAASKRLALIRIFSFLSAGAAVVIIASGFLRTIVHFMLKNSLINECTALATGQNVVTVWGVWNTGPEHPLTPTEALQCVSFRGCHRAIHQALFFSQFATVPGATTRFLRSSGSLPRSVRHRSSSTSLVNLWTPDHPW